MLVELSWPSLHTAAHVGTVVILFVLQPLPSTCIDLLRYYEAEIQHLSVHDFYGGRVGFCCQVAELVSQRVGKLAICP